MARSKTVAAGRTTGTMVWAGDRVITSRSQIPVTFSRRVVIHPCSPSSITAYHNLVGMTDGKRLKSSLDLLKRHYLQVASLQDYIYSILNNATEIALVIPDDPEEFRDLLENSRVGYHQPPSRKYRAGSSVFEIDEVDTSKTCSAFGSQTVRSSKGPSGVYSVLRVL